MPKWVTVLHFEVFDDDEWVSRVAERWISYMSSRSDARICLATGETPRPVYTRSAPEVDLSTSTIFLLDEFTISIRGIGAEVALDHIETSLDQVSVINCDGLQTIRRSSLTRRVGSVVDATMEQVCRALNYALDCRERRRVLAHHDRGKRLQRFGRRGLRGVTHPWMVTNAALVDAILGWSWLFPLDVRPA